MAIVTNRLVACSCFGITSRYGFVYHSLYLSHRAAYSLQVCGCWIFEGQDLPTDVCISAVYPALTVPGS